MIPDHKIRTTVRAMIAFYGDMASLEAALYADQLMDRGDLDGSSLWARLTREIEATRAVGSGSPVRGSLPGHQWYALGHHVIGKTGGNPG